MNLIVRDLNRHGNVPLADAQAPPASGTPLDASARRSFVFLQGPPGPLLHRLAQAMRDSGASVERINICAGDWIDWPEPATNFRGQFRDWPVFFDDFLRRHGITDILLFGDCRPYHVTALRLAALRGIRAHVLEEGYIRPHWMTLELDGVNGYSPLRRNKDRIIEQAKALPPEKDLPPVTADQRRRIRDSARHYIAVHALSWTYPFYTTHRPGSPLLEGLGWCWKTLVRQKGERRAQATLKALEGKPFFLLPLQLSGDYQIRNHSPFPDMPAAAAYVMESFAAHAPAGVHLLVKAHPLDFSFFNWRGYLRRRARRLGILERVHFIDGGDLDDLAADATGMVCVNSTSATLALAAGTPVSALGEAIYALPGVTFQGHLDDFWLNPPRPDPGLYRAFRRLLVERCLVRGGLASESAVTTLVKSMVDRLCKQPAAQKCPNHSSTAVKWASQLGAS